ncbi:MAG: tetratricopeptide repeat protein [Chitinivibrionales bacterium]|nr:tetratricopeptide repeat protein [Chitinivibrionales bacterium]
MSMAMRRTLCICVWLCVTSAHARFSVAAFPLINNDSAGAELTDWVACVPAESIARASRYMDDIRVWDPAFMYQVDSSAWRLDNDTTVLAHQQRWSWDLALGGSFTTDGDTIHMTIRAVRTDNNTLRKRLFRVSGRSMLVMMERLVVEVFTAMGEPRIGSGLARHVRQVTEREEAYRTYAAGYCFELHGDNRAAASAYLHALDKDPDLTFAAVRMARLYAQSRDTENAERWMAHAAGRARGDAVITGIVAAYYVEHGDPERAAKYVDGHEEKLGATADGLVALGKHRMHRGSYERAIAYLTKAVAYGPPNLEADFALGQAYLLAGELDMAAEVFNRLVTYRPSHARYYSFLGAAYRQLGRLMESVDMLTAAREMHPNDAPLMIHLASTYIELGWLEEAERLLLEARDINPALKEIESNLAVVYWRQGHHEKARSLLRKTPRTKRTVQAKLNNEAGMLLKSGDYKAALRRLRKAEESGPKTEEVLYNLGMVCMRLERLREAAEWFDELLRVAPERRDVLLLKAQVDVRRGELEGAERALRHVLALSPHNEEAVTELATVLVRLGREKGATDVLEGYLNEFPSDVSARLTLADICLDLEWYDVAAMHYGRAAAHSPNHYRAQLGLGKSLYGAVVHKGRDQVDSALAALKKAQALRPDAAEPDLFLGRLYLEGGDNRALAKTHLESAARKARERALRREIEEALGRAEEAR